MFDLKAHIKNLNINELLFDFFIVILLIIFRKIVPVFQSTAFSNDFYEGLLLVFLFVFPMIIFVTTGKIAGSFREHKSGYLLGVLSLLTIVFVGLAIFIILEDYYNYFLDDIALLAFLVAVLPALSLGFYSRAKNFLKIITVSGLFFLLGIIGIMAIYLLSESLYKDSFSLFVSIGIVVFGFLVFVFLPRKLVKWSIKSENGRKFLANAFAVLSALSFAAWHFISENQLISQDDFGNTYESSLFNLYWLAVLLFRLMLAFEPPKNRLNLIIGLVVIVISYII